jgi:hypothetical protein
MNLPHSLTGYKLVENPYLTKATTTKIGKPRLTRLVEAILQWNPCNNPHWLTPDFKTEHTPSDQVIISGNNIYAHPRVIAELKKVIVRDSVVYNPSFVCPPVRRPEASLFAIDATC